MLLLVSLLLVIVSGILLWTWGYRVYNKNDNGTVKTQPADSAAIARVVRDSLQQQYTATLQELNTQIDSTLYGSDSLRGQLSAKLEEFFRLRDEINELLKDKSGSFKQDLAKQKIIELQIKVQELRNRNADVEQENKKLNALLAQLKDLEKNNPGQDNARRVFYDNRSAENNIPVSAVFTASDLRLSAVMTDNDRETETSSAQQTEKLVGSFVVRNAGAVNNSEIMVVVVQPDGRVLKGSAWESGIFSTPEGKKIYSYKLSFDYSRGESKKLLFSLSADKYQKGNYIMQVYHNGSLIGKLSKSLS
jgi:hypothetical protein